MESFNEQPTEERQESQAEQKESGSFELYEFPPASGEMEQVQEPSMEDYLEGRVYPDIHAPPGSLPLMVLVPVPFRLKQVETHRVQTSQTLFVLPVIPGALLSVAR